MTDYSRTLRPPGDGGDYSSLGSLSSIMSDVGAIAGDTATVHVQGDWDGIEDDSSLTLTGIVGAADHLYIIADSANRSQGNWDTTRYRCVGDGSGNSPLVGGDAGITIVGLQLRGSTTLTRSAYIADAAGDIDFDSCHLIGPSQSGIRVAAAVTIRAKNCYFSDSHTALHLFNASAVAILHNCTARNCTNFGFRRQTAGSTLTIRNSIAMDCASDFNGTMTREYCASSDATATGTGGITNATFTFASSTSGILSTSDTSGAIGGGTNLSADGTLPVVNDILGVAYLNPPSMGVNEAGDTGGGGDEIELTGAALGGGMASCACGPLTNALGAILSDGRANSVGSPVASSEAYTLGSGQYLADGSTIADGVAEGLGGAVAALSGEPIASSVGAALGGGYAEGEVEPLTTAATAAMAESRGGARSASLMSSIVGAVSRLFGAGQADASGAGLAATSGDTLGGGYVEGGDQLPTRNAEASVRGGGMLSATATAITGAFAGVRGGGRVSQALSSLTSAMLSLFGGGRTESQFGTVLPATPPTISNVRIAAGPTVSNVRIVPGPTVSNVRVTQ